MKIEYKDYQTALASADGLLDMAYSALDNRSNSTNSNPEGKDKPEESAIAYALIGIGYALMALALPFSEDNE